MSNKLRPNVVLMMLAAAFVALAAMLLISEVGDGAENVAAIVGVAGTFLAMAGSTARELVAPEKSDVELVLEYFSAAAESDDG